MLLNGVDLPRLGGMTMMAHTEDDIEQTVDAVAGTMDMLRRKGSFHKHWFRSSRSPRASAVAADARPPRQRERLNLVGPHAARLLRSSGRQTRRQR